MKTLLFLQINSIISKGILEYVVALGKDLNVRTKFLYIHYPDVLYSATLSTNMELFQTTHNPAEFAMEDIRRIEADVLELKERGLIDSEQSFEYFTGVPEVILKSKLLKGEFDMLALGNEYISSGINPYQPLKSIIKNINCPIWIIPGSPYKGIKSALYATDYQQQDINSVRLLFQMLGATLQKLIFVHLTDERGFFQKIISMGFNSYMKEEFKFNEFASVVINTEGNKTISSYFQDAMDNYHSDFIVALKENKNLFQKVFYRSFTTKLLKEIEDLVLILHVDEVVPVQENNKEEE